MLVLALAGGAVPAIAHSRGRHSESWAKQHFSAAERVREALNGRPLEERSRHDYQRVLDAYRLVYRGAPNSTKADPSVVAVAETLAEMGRRFEDKKILEEAVGQYKFLRREYPGSRYRFDALFRIGEIYQDELSDPAAAAAAFQEFVRRYPNNHLAPDARQAIVALNRRETPAAKIPQDRQSQTVAEARSSRPQRAGAKRSETRNQDDDEAAGNPASNSAPNAGSEEDAVAKNVTDTGGNDSATNNEDQNRSGQTEGAPHAKMVRVTGIRHWSTRDATRIAIDVDNSIEFSSQRIDHPSRIYFDLRDTRLAAALLGKNLDVEDGFLKKVRVAQFSPHRARVVLEVAEGSEYDAFFIPNPPRLIIDIRGDTHGKSGLASTARRATTNDFGSEAITQPVPSASGAAMAEFDKSVAPVAESNQDRLASASSVSAPDAGLGAKPLHDAVVKRVVDADDDDSDDTARDTTSAPPEAKRTTRALNKAISKKTEADGAEDGEDESKSTVAESNPKSSPKKLNGSKGRATGRALVSSDVGFSPSGDVGAREAIPTAGGDRSLIRALGLKIGKIVIDPGHGGHDTGTIGPNGLEEKDLVLEVGRRLGKMLETRLGAEVVYTRKDDTFIPLETRTAIANQARADLFVSIHANSSHDPDARGVETYYLNFTSSPDALEVAARENAVSETSIYELQDLVKKIALKEKIEESREFAWDVQQSLHTGLASRAPAIRDRGVKKAPFIVLIGANMPSILAEVSFVSNPTDERHLSTSEYRQRIAESLYRGIAKYVNGLSGVKVASKLEKTASAQ